jgi:hypothetical protein
MTITVGSASAEQPANVAAVAKLAAFKKSRRVKLISPSPRLTA